MSFRPPLSPSYNSTSFQSPSNQPPSTDDETLNRYNLHNDDDIDIEDDRDYIDVKTNGENTRLLRATSATTKAFTLGEGMRVGGKEDRRREGTTVVGPAVNSYLNHPLNSLRSSSAHPPLVIHSVL
jgi:hypothetical protein